MKYIWLLLLSFFAIACNKQIEDRSNQYPLLNPTKTDANAGSWKLILLAAPDAVEVATPSGASGPDYIAQLNEIRSLQASITSQRTREMHYWGAGAVLRWNEITRQLVAKHNRPPFQNDDGTYPIPDAANPLAYPTFPFANPPYASRAYAYVSAACYDALVSCYYYKAKFNRSAPSLINTSITPLLPQSNLPSYPSEDGTVAGVMWEMMKLLFPGDQAYIQERINEHMQARMSSGTIVRSDWDAGYTLGRQVALQFVARARTDRAGASVGNPAIWKKMEDDIVAAGLTPWKSQESPARPGMLPLFGKVKAWNLDDVGLVAIRPPVPPAVGSELFKKELNEIYEISKRPTQEQVRIAQFWSDGVGTSTPPGHWNSIAADDFVEKGFSEVRWARNLALLNMAMMDAAIACWDAKYFYYTPRPFQIDNRIKTVVGLPNFPSYTSGHSTFSGAAAAVLGHIIPSRASDYSTMATEASLSRMYGAIHFRSDCEQGLICGQRVGGFSVDRAKTDGADQ